MKNNYNRILPQQYKICRYAIFVTSILTAINILFIALNIDYGFLFSAVFPQVIMALGTFLTAESGESLFSVLALIISIVILLTFFTMYFISKNKFGGMITALVLFSLDTLFTIYYCIAYFDPTFIIYLIFHAVILIYLIRGIIIGSKLTQYPNGVATTEEELCKILNVSEDFSDEVIQTLNEINITPDFSKANSKPIGNYNGKGICRIVAVYNSSEIKLVETGLQIFIAIDNKIYDSVSGFATASQFTIQATINGITYKVCQKNKGLRGILTLYANDKVLATSKRWR